MTATSSPLLLSQMLQTVNSFDGISQLLREGMVHEESRDMRDTVGTLSSQIEAAVNARRTSRDERAIVQAVHALTRGLRAHQKVINELGPAWQALYEYDAYQRTLSNLSQSVMAWQQALQRRSRTEAHMFEQFELLAWRTVGEAMLIIDMYTQGGNTGAKPQAPAAPPPRARKPRPAAVRRPTLLQRVRAWFG